MRRESQPTPKHREAQAPVEFAATSGKAGAQNRRSLEPVPGRPPRARLPHRRLLGLADLLVVVRLELLPVAKDAKVAHHVRRLAEAAQSLLDPACSTTAAC